MKLTWASEAGTPGVVARPFGHEGPFYTIEEGDPGPLKAFGYAKHYAVTASDKGSLGSASDFKLAAELATREAFIFAANLPKPAN